jgi:glycerophosphoryl diester phosphodiesterase family protein
MALPDLKPRSGVELIDASFQFLRENFVLLFTTVAVAYAPIAVMEYMAAMDPLNVWLRLSAGLVAWFLSAFAQAATVSIVAKRYMGEDVTPADALRAAWSRIGTVLLITLEYGLGVGIGLALLIVPGLYFGTKYFAALPSAMVEGKTTRQAMQRSASLTEGTKMRVLGIFFVTLLVYLLLNGAIAGLAQAFTTAPLATLIARLSMAITNPFLFTLVTLAYFDLRIRREGLDLDVMLAHAPAAATTSAAQ